MRAAAAHELTLDVPVAADVREAQARIAGYVHRTPVVRSRTLSERIGANVHLKLEMFQKSGAFNVRGAFNRMLALTHQERERGVVAVSAGNHAPAVAYAARALGVPAVMLMLESTPVNYLEATAEYGATILLFATPGDALAAAHLHVRQGFTYIDPLADPRVIAGHGTLGLEILEDVPEATDVIVSIGGGGLAGGVALAIKSQRASVRVWGVATAGAKCMARALAAGRVVCLRRESDNARSAARPSEQRDELAQRYLEGVTIVSRQSAMEALRFLLERVKVLTEPACSCTLAAAEGLRRRFTRDSHVVLVLCSGNTALSEIERSGE